MRRIRTDTTIRALLPWIVLIQLAFTIPSSGFLVPMSNVDGRRASVFNTAVTEKYELLKFRRVRAEHHRYFTSSSSNDRSERRRYLSEEQVNELLSGGLKKGQPSYPAWQSERKRKTLYEMTEWATSDEANRPIICEYEPDAWWLWTKWSGTALSMTYTSIIINVSIGILVDWYVHSHTATSWNFFSVPPSDDPLILELSGFKTLWEYQLTLCTFILAFFTSQAYSYWRAVYFTTRAIQGRINDICLIITTNAERETVINAEGNKVSDYSDRAKELVATCTRLIRVSHTL